MDNMSTTVAISCGCPAGVGIELFAKALVDAALPAEIRLRFCAPAAVARLGAARAGVDATQRGNSVYIGDTELLCTGENAPTSLRPAAVDVDAFVAGRPNPAALQLQRDSLLHAIALADEGEAAGLLTLPIRKASLADVNGRSFLGHTELLAAELSDGRGPALMVFAEGPFLLGLATVHVPLSEVSASVTQPHIRHALARLLDVTRVFSGAASPKIVVLGHNPHAGEGGVLGTEERTAISPAMRDVESEEAAQNRPVDLVGPVPADGFFAHHRAYAADAVLAMHHDQGLGPYKILSEGRGVNVTWGLRCVRTSPDHGTADDIAGLGTADPRSVRAALTLCAKIACSRS